MPDPTPNPRRPVIPADAASLVIVRGQGTDAEVLMGRRRPRAGFLPNIYVFPGGRVDPEDNIVPAGLRLPEALESKIKQRCRTSPAMALAMAVVRETFEETGLLIAAPGKPADAAAMPDTPMWRAFGAAGAVPALGALDYIARAITPARSHRRYNTRFFVVDASHAEGELLGDGELLDLHWVPIRMAKEKLKVVDVTEFVLNQAVAHRAAPPDDRVRHRVRLLYYVGNRRRFAEE